MGRTFVVIFAVVFVALSIGDTAAESEKTRAAALFDALKGDAGTRPDAGSGLKCPIPDGAPCDIDAPGGQLHGHLRCSTVGNGGCKCDCFVPRPPPRPPDAGWCVVGPEQDRPPHRHCTPPEVADWYCQDGRWIAACRRP